MKTGDLSGYGLRLLKDKGLTQNVDIEKFNRALERRDGMPVDITASVPRQTQFHVSR